MRKTGEVSDVRGVISCPDYYGIREGWSVWFGSGRFAVFPALSNGIGCVLPSINAPQALLRQTPYLELPPFGRE
jgi:hypothetical protein